MIAGVLYSSLGARNLFLWIFGIFALVHLMYSFQVRVTPGSTTLVAPFLYAIAVSLYTVVNFAIWPDISGQIYLRRRQLVSMRHSAWPYLGGQRRLLVQPSQFNCGHPVYLLKHI
jgi:hypothetical protein